MEKHLGKHDKECSFVAQEGNLVLSEVGNVGECWRAGKWSKQLFFIIMKNNKRCVQSVK